MNLKNYSFYIKTTTMIKATNPQLTSAVNYNFDNLYFCAPEAEKMGGAPSSNKHITIMTKYSDGTYGDLIFQTPENLFSFGIQQEEDPNTKIKKEGKYQMPICILDKDSPTKEQLEFVDVITELIKRCKEQIVEKRLELGLGEDYTLRDLKEFGDKQLKYKKDKLTKQKIMSIKPTLQPSIPYSKKTGRVRCLIYDANTGHPIENPIETLNRKFCRVNCAIKPENIFIGKIPTLRMSVYQVDVKLVGDNLTPILPRSKPTDKLLVSNSTNPLGTMSDDEESDDEKNDSKVNKLAKQTEQILLSDDEEEKEFKPLVKPVVEKKPVKRNTKKVNL